MANEAKISRDAACEMPSVRQMAARSNAWHKIALDLIAEGREPYLPPRAAKVHRRAISTARATPLKWGCVDLVQPQDGGAIYAHLLTRRGRDLLDFLSSEIPPAAIAKAEDR